MNLIRKIEQICLDCRPLNKDKKVLLALSGGPDSLFLASVIQKLALKHSWDCSALHVNHQLRGQESEQEQALLVQNAAHMSLKLDCLSIDLSAVHSGLEQKAREARYKALAQFASQRGISLLMTAHHADDQAETVLMRLMRGCNLQGLSGMSTLSTVPGFAKLGLFRPLLGIWRKEILDYLAQHGLNYCLDSSNKDLRFLRNRVRSELIPWMEQKGNAQVRKHIVQLAQIAEQSQHFIKQAVSEDFRKLVRCGSDISELEIARLWFLPEIKQRSLVHAMISEFPGHEGAVDAHKVEQVLQMLKSSPGGSRILLSRGLMARKAKGFLQVLLQKEKEDG